MVAIVGLSNSEASGVAKELAVNRPGICLVAGGEEPKKPLSLPASDKYLNVCNTTNHFHIPTYNNSKKRDFSHGWLKDK